MHVNINPFPQYGSCKIVKVKEVVIIKEIQLQVALDSLQK